MKKINKKETITFLIILVITFAIFTPFLTGHYATDTLNVENLGYQKYAIEWSLNDGRIFMSAITLLAGKVNMPIEAFSFITLFLSLIVSCICVMKLKSIIDRYKKSKNIWQDILVIVMSYVTIFNFMYVEDMYFVESFVMSISVLLFIIAADILVEKEKDYFLKSLILVITGVMCYQGSICIFFAMTLLISILKNNKNIKQITIDIIKSGIISLTGVIINIILVKIIGMLYGMKQTRLNSVDKIFRNIRLITKGTYEILTDSCGLYPKYLYLIFMAVIMLFECFYIIKYKKEQTILIKLISIIIMGILSSSVVFILALTSFYSGRLRLSIGATIGMLFILLYTQTDIFENKSFFKYSIISMLIIYAITIVSTYIYLMISHKEVNKLEKIQVEEINNYISKYEEETGIKINNIVKVKVTGRTEEAYYSSIKNKSTFTFTAVRSDLVADGVINHYTNRNLKTIYDFDYKNQSKEFIKEIITSKEGYLCKGDTFYINVYMF